MISSWGCRCAKQGQRCKASTGETWGVSSPTTTPTRQKGHNLRESRGKNKWHLENAIKGIPMMLKWGEMFTRPLILVSKLSFFSPWSYFWLPSFVSSGVCKHLRQIVHLHSFHFVPRRSRRELLCHPPYVLTAGGKILSALLMSSLTAGGKREVRTSGVLLII